MISSSHPGTGRQSVVMSVSPCMHETSKQAEFSALYIAMSSLKSPSVHTRGVQSTM